MPFSSDFNGLAPWTYIGSVRPGAEGMSSLSVQYGLGGSAVQAVRVDLRYGNSVGSCAGGEWDDADDLAFAVATGGVRPLGPEPESVAPLDPVPSGACAAVVSQERCEGTSACCWIEGSCVDGSSCEPESVEPTRAPTQPPTELAATYFVGYETRGCSGRNELYIGAQPTVEACADLCNANAACISFEYKKGTTKCQLSNSCLYGQSSTSSGWNLYVRAPNGNPPAGTPQGDNYLWLLGNEGAVVAPAELTTTSYYVGYDTGGCSGLNELGITSKPTLEDCAASCEANPDCVSFESKKSSTTCNLSSTCVNFDMTLNQVGNSYMWYGRATDGYTGYEQMGGNAYLWLFN